MSGKKREDNTYLTTLLSDLFVSSSPPVLHDIFCLRLWSSFFILDAIIMQLLTILLALPLITALPACPPTSAVPSPSPSPKPPVSYLGRRLLFQYTLQKCMVAKGNWVGAEVGL
jgi:hypothetical protein